MAMEVMLWIRIVCFSTVCFHCRGVHGQTLNGDQRLVDNSGTSETSINAGRLEVFLDGRWGAVCELGFGLHEADVACRFMAFGYAGSFNDVSTLGFLRGSQPIVMSNVTCPVDMPPENYGFNYCSYDSGQNCINNRVIGLRCVNGDSFTMIRLAPRRTSPEVRKGRLEIFVNGEWGTVSNDSFNINAANVACRQLRFSGAITHSSAGIEGYPLESCNTPIWLNNVTCRDGSVNFRHCSGNSVSPQNCDHVKDVVISCFTAGTLRLAPHFNSSGRLEINVNGKWGTFCIHGFRHANAVQACKQLGYTTALSYSDAGSLSYWFQPVPGGTPIWKLSTNCNEELMNCLTTSSSPPCSHANEESSTDVVLSCATPVSDLLRLVSTTGRMSNISSGRLEALVDGRWGTVCSSGFDSSAAMVACRQLGFADVTTYGLINQLGFTEASSSTPVSIQGVECSPYETNLLHCSRRYETEYCSHSRDIAIVCLHYGALRLVYAPQNQGNSPVSSGFQQSSGRLEIYLNNEWGTVSSYSFSNYEADPACRQLGFTRSERYGNVREIGLRQASRNSRNWLTYVSCPGNAQIFLDCVFVLSNDSTAHNHDTDVGITCAGGISTGGISTATLHPTDIAEPSDVVIINSGSDSSSSSGSGVAIGGIIAGVIGGVIFIVIIGVVGVIIGLVIAFFVSNRKKSSHNIQSNRSQQYPAQRQQYPAQQYPAQRQQYPAQQYPAQHQQYPAQQYPAQRQQYPAQQYSNALPAATTSFIGPRPATQQQQRINPSSSAQGYPIQTARFPTSGSTQQPGIGVPIHSSWVQSAITTPQNDLQPPKPLPTSSSAAGQPGDLTPHSETTVSSPPAQNEVQLLDGPVPNDPSTAAAAAQDSSSSEMESDEQPLLSSSKD